MSVYLVTGGAGFIGSHITEELIRQGHHVRVLDNFSTGKRENLGGVSNAIELLKGDVRNLNIVRQAVRGVDFVLHHAALVSVPESIADPASTHQVTATGTLNILLAAREAHVKRVVYASTCAVYGDNPRLPLSEDAFPRPLSPYAAAKLSGEAYAYSFAQVYGMPAVCLRYFNVYGPRQDPAGDYAGVIAKFMKRMSADQPPIIYGDGSQTRDFIYVQDVVRANLLACRSECAAGRAINIATGRSVSLLELIVNLNTLLDTALAPIFTSSRPGDVLHSQADVDLAEQLLGFQAQVPLDIGLDKLIQYNRERRTALQSLLP